MPDHISSNGNGKVDSVQAAPFVDGLYFGEGPRWHEGRLWYSDFFDHAVFSVGTDGVPREEVSVPSQPSGLGWLPDGRLLLVAMIDRKVLRKEADGTLAVHASLEPWATFHGNDMVVSSEGRAYVGNFGFDLHGLMQGEGSPSNASIVLVTPDGTASEAASDLAFPNGSVLFPDGKTLVVAESMGFRLTAFDVASDGTLSGRREWAALTGIAPDGICLDAEGCIWVANAMGSECVRIAEGGEVVGRVVTSQGCFACMLGGEDRRTLFTMTAPSSEPHIASADRKGRIERTTVEVPGAGLP